MGRGREKGKRRKGDKGREKGKGNERGREREGGGEGGCLQGYIMHKHEGGLKHAQNIRIFNRDVLRKRDPPLPHTGMEETCKR